MIKKALNDQERKLIAMEVRHFFLHPQILHAVPLSLSGIMLVLWPYFSSPFVAVMIVVFASLEPQINNILFRTPRELEAISILPVEWSRVVKAKNLATLLLLLIIFPIVSATLLYFSSSVLNLQRVQDAVLYILTVVFPLLHVGNMRSVQNPRRRYGWQVDDLAGAVELLMSLAILSVPYLVMNEVLAMPVLSLVYAGGTAVFWMRYSIPKTAHIMQSRKIELCLTR